MYNVEFQHGFNSVRELKEKLAHFKSAVIEYIHAFEGGIGLREDNDMKSNCITLKYAWEKGKSLYAPELEAPAKVISLLRQFGLGQWVNGLPVEDYTGMSKWEVLHEITSSILLDNLTHKERQAVRYARNRVTTLLQTDYQYLR